MRITTEALTEFMTAVAQRLAQGGTDLWPDLGLYGPHPWFILLAYYPDSRRSDMAEIAIELDNELWPLDPAGRIPRWLDNPLSNTLTRCADALTRRNLAALTAGSMLDEMIAHGGTLPPGGE